MLKISTRRFVFGALIAGLYVVLTLGLAPISYGVIQFRVSEVLKAFVLFDPFFALWIGIGTFFANMVSPFAGPWDLVWMPITDVVGGVIAWGLFAVLRRRFAVLPMIVYALTTGAAVGLMLQAFGLGGFWFLSATVAASELIILVAGTPMILWIVRMLEARGVSLIPDLG